MGGGSKPHVLAVAVPAQGHLKPLMSLCRQIAKRGIKVTIINAKTIHDKLISAAKVFPDQEVMEVSLSSIPDGLKPDDDPRDPFLLLRTLPKTMPETLPNLIQRINHSNPISCVIADLSFGWVLDIAENMGVEAVGFSPPSVAPFAVLSYIPRLIEQGNLDTNGSLMKVDLISLSDNIPVWRKDEFPWSVSNDLITQKLFYECEQSYKFSKKARWLICNSCYELEPAACDLHPNLLTVGPLHLGEENSCSDCSNFYPEDPSCLSWLDNKPDGSVVYVSFGSFAVYSQQQLDELALGLELSGRAFLWVVRQDLANGSPAAYVDGFLERMSELGKIVEWAPQNEVLSHPAIACFLSHCGWNSTLEGVSRGVPYLCWPYFADQVHNATYICDKWEIGLRINFDENGIRSRYEIKNKIDMLLSDNKFKDNVLELKEMCVRSVSKGGSSNRNLETFVNHLLKRGI